ncbi:hypothetical protein [Marinifilum sp. D737]|uniref:hypothetical protein n=1 Tax=Marinifilum sp. D737 TaxID=2969628 RepID=UPI002272E350|nr:hypothetical protein [Marinifilum sp. D737]MCY1635484.1 hypothetical protein [Marinifilum sp. D737]
MIFFSIKSFLIAFGLLLFDLIVYLFLSLMLMNYDDFYDEKKGAYWSLDSMSFWQKANYIGLNVWHLINMIAIGYVIYRLVKAIKNKSLS